MSGGEPSRLRLDAWVISATSCTLGVAGVLALAGGLGTSLPTLVLAGLLGAAGLMALLAARWVEPLSLLVVALPLPALYATEDVRLSPILPVSALAVGAWLLNGPPVRSGRAAASLKSMAALVGAVAVASLFAEAPVAALRELVNVGLLLGVLLVSFAQIREVPARAEGLALGLAGVAAVVGGAAVLETLGVLPGRFPLGNTGLARAAGGFGWPNELGMFLSISLPFCVHALAGARRGWTKGVALVGLGLATLGLAATFSRGSWLAVLVAPCALVLVGRAGTALRFWAGALVAVAVTEILTGGAVSTRVMSTTGDVLVAQRLLLMAAGLLMVQAHPVVGVGPGGFGDALERFGLQVSGLFDYVGSAHNGYVHMAAEAGILGLAALVSFLGITLWTLGVGARPGVRQPARRARSPGDTLGATFFWSFVTVCLVSFFEWPFAHGVGELIALVAGAGLAWSTTREGS